MAEAPARARATVLHTALLVLLAQRDSHGYDLGNRLSQLGLAPDHAALYRTLRSMDRRGEVTSSWDGSAPGPARRVYGLSDKGRRVLRPALESLRQHSLAVSRVLDHSAGLVARAPQHLNS